MIDEEDELNELLGQGPGTCAIDGCSNPPYDDVVYIQGVAVAVCHRHYIAILMIIGEDAPTLYVDDIDVGEDIPSEDVPSEDFLDEVQWAIPKGANHDCSRA